MLQEILDTKKAIKPDGQPCNCITTQKTSKNNFTNSERCSSTAAYYNTDGNHENQKLQLAIQRSIGKKKKK